MCSCYSLEAGDDSTLVFVFDEFLHFRRLEGFDELLDFRTVLVTSADDEDIYIGGILRFYIQGVLQGIEACFEGEVRVDAGNVYVIDGAGNLGSFQFNELEVLVVLVYVTDRRGNGAAVLQGDEACRLEQEQGAAAVSRVVGDGYLGAVLDILQILDRRRIDAHRFQMDFAGFF